MQDAEMDGQHVMAPFRQETPSGHRGTGRGESIIIERPELCAFSQIIFFPFIVFKVSGYY